MDYPLFPKISEFRARKRGPAAHLDQYSRSRELSEEHGPSQISEELSYGLRSVTEELSYGLTDHCQGSDD
eukprot:738902-Hanusia_phi.AAC.1